MICKLCKKECELLKKSHIIPNFLYKPIKGDDGEFYALSSFKNKIDTKKVYTGYFEKNILCKNCDNKIINEYETYFSNIVKKLEHRKLNVVEKVNVNNVKYIEISPVDYTNTKLFFLSILWRASISTLNEFSRIKLRTENEEEIRKMILNRDPGEENYYPIFPMMIPNTPLSVTKTFVETILEGVKCFSLVITGTPHFFFIENTCPKWILGHGPRVENKFSTVLLTPKQGEQIQQAWIEETVNILKKKHDLKNINK